MARASRGALTLPRGDRLRRPTEFQTVFQHGKREECESFVALWSRAGRHRRVGFAVTRRVRGAVRRNRVRRRLREAYRQHQGLLPDPVQVVFVGRHTALTVPFSQLLGDMHRMLTLLAKTGGARRAGRAVTSVSGP